MSFLKKNVSDDLSRLQGITVEEVEKMSDDELDNLGSKKARPGRRSYEGNLKKIVTVLTVLMSLYHLYAAIFSQNPLNHRATHLVFVLTLVFFLYPASGRSPRKKPGVIDLTLILAAWASLGYLIYRIKPIIKAGGRINDADVIFGVIIAVLVMEAARRTLGNTLPIMALVMFVYAKIGPMIPGPLRHSGFNVKRLMQFLVYSTEGVFGSVLNVSATYIFLFILFGAVLSATGMAKVFNDLALALAGGRRGGPAKVSILASGLMGTVSGSTSANVVTTGAFTIPLMKKTGYKDYFASSVEAAASTGGQIMPPVMGSASFLIADNLNLPYITIIKSAVLPAILYYLSIWIMVDLRARKEHIYGVSKSELPSFKKVLFERGHLLLPLLAIIGMLVAGYNAIKAALVSMAIAIAASFLKKSTRINIRDLVKALESGALAALSVASACAVIGITVGILALTGSTLTLGKAVLAISRGNIIITLVLTMFVAIILGMGMPTSACYILTSTIAAPTLITMGMEPLVAHMFCFYFGILSPITPPVATGSYSAAGLSGADPTKTGWTALKLASAGFIIPYMFAFSPELLLPAGISPLMLVRVVVTSIIGVFCLAYCIEGFYRRKLKTWERIVSAAGAICLISSGLVTDIIGVVVFALMYLLNFKFNPDETPSAQAGN